MSGRRRPNVELQRIYGHPGDTRTYRVLVDRLWPRGVAKEDAALDEWAKDVAPTAELRRWYAHAPERYEEFARRCRAELGRPPAAEVAARLGAVARARPLLLLTATRDLERSTARVLRDHLLA